jgi:hypothetical protein
VSADTATGNILTAVPVSSNSLFPLSCRSVEKALQLDPSSDLLEQLLPAKAGDLELAKLPAPSRLVIYLLDGLPILLDTSGKGDYVPTVLGLWACPSLLPVVMLKHWQVSHYITGGARGGWPFYSSIVFAVGLQRCSSSKRWQCKTALQDASWIRGCGVCAAAAIQPGLLGC